MSLDLSQSFLDHLDNVLAAYEADPDIRSLPTYSGPSDARTDRILRSLNLLIHKTAGGSSDQTGEQGVCASQPRS